MQSRFINQIKELLQALNDAGVQFALIGGLALASYKVVRATQDIDLLVDADDADSVDALLLSLGYQCIHRSADAGNYLRDDERVDLLYASRPIARGLLATAVEDQTIIGDLRVLSIEGLVGFKLQALANDQPISGGEVLKDLPSRTTTFSCSKRAPPLPQLLCRRDNT